MQTLDSAEIVPPNKGDLFRLRYWSIRRGLRFRIRRRGVSHHNLHATADIVLIVEKLGDHSVQFCERSCFLCRFALAHKIGVCLTQQIRCVIGFGSELMNVLHTLADILQNLVTFDVQQIVVCGFRFADQLRQLADAAIGLRHGKDR